MAQEIYTHALKVQIGRVVAAAAADDYFPIISTNINISASTKWAKTSEWQLQDGSGQTVTESGAIVLQKDGKTVHVTAEGELIQVFIARNSLSETTVQKTVYAMRPQTLPYFVVSATKEVVRTDGEEALIYVTPENGYAAAHAIALRVYAENKETAPVYSSNSPQVDESGGEYFTFSRNLPLDRGIYDVEVDVTDSLSGITFSKRINKLVTVMPRLAPEPSDRRNGYRDILATKSFTTYSGQSKVDFFIRLWENTGDGLSYAELIIPAGEQNGTSWYESIDISVLPSGTTLVLLNDPNEPDSGYARRVLFKGNNPTSVSNSSGTPNFSWESPLIITINQDSPYHIPFQSYAGINFDGNCRHIVLDGRGYKNISKGIHIHKYSPDSFGETCVFLVNGTSDVELSELELSDCDFTAVMGKTDPDPNRPWFWFGNWEMHNLFLHHTHIHDTHGEGFYIGYFTPETKKGSNNKGDQVSFRAHALVNTRIYRNLMENMGYDGMQLSNARGAEVCYNEVYNASWRGDKDQCSGISIQSMSGRCYNNIVHKFNGAGLQIGPLGDLEVFNNVIYDCPEGQPGVMFLFSVDTPEQNPNGDDINDTIKMHLHNNVIVCNGVAFNGRNTVQVKGLYAEDNIVVYKIAKFGNMAIATLAQWEAQASGNTWIKQGVIDFVAIDSHKIADSANGNFQIAADSPLIQGGGGEHFKFDFRGYKNWFPNIYPVGAFLGKYRDPNIEIIYLTLHGILINEGADSTYLPDLSVRFNYVGSAKEYRMGVKSDLSDATWQPMAAGTTYTLDNVYGNRTVYAQLRNGSEMSEIVSSPIEFIHKTTMLSGLTINNEEGSTIFDLLSVKMEYLLGTPSHCMISESELFTGADWREFADTVEYRIIGDSRRITLYAKVKLDDIESDVLTASIEYTSTIEYREVTLKIPLPEPGNADNIQVSIPELKYNKRFAFSWTMDDTLIYVYSRMFNYINKKWVDDSKIIHDGMPKTTGAVPARYLSYSDGCGRDVRFGLNTGFISHLNGKGAVLDGTFTGSQFFHLNEMKKFIDFGNGLQNHGAGPGYNADGADVGIDICINEVKDKLGFTPFLLLFPGEEDKDAWAAAGYKNPDVYQMTSGIKNDTISLTNLTDGFFRNKRSLMNRLTYDNYTLAQLKEKADYAYTQNNAHLMNFGGHNILVGDSRFLDWEITVKPFLDYLYDTYGRGGNDSIWFAPLEEIYEYIFMRHFSTIETLSDGESLIISLRLASMKNFRQGDITLRLSGVDLSGVNTITSGTQCYYLAKGLQADGSLLVNLNTNANLSVLAEKYVSAFEAMPGLEMMEDAAYMISRLREDLKKPLQNRLDAINKPFALNAIAINSGADVTTKQEVKVVMSYDGFIAPQAYRLSESADLSSMDWIDFIPEAPFTLSPGLGIKTVYCQLKSKDGTLSEVKSDGIDLIAAGKKKTIVSIGWSQAEIPSTVEGYYDAQTGITRFNSQGNINTVRKIYDIYGEQIGTAVPSANNVSMLSLSVSQGAITGNNSGVYTDEYLRHNSCYAGSKEGSVNILFTLPAGTYKVRLLCNTIWNVRPIPNEALSYRAITDTDNVAVTLPASGVLNNTANLTDPVTVRVGDTGLLKIEFGLSAVASSYYYAPLNVIEIEEM